MNPSDFLVPLNQELVSFERWLELYELVKKQKSAKRFGYGFEVDDSNTALSYFPEILALKKSFNLADSFFFLISHAKINTFPIHIDGEIAGGNSSSLNWPLLNCDKSSKTVWHRPESFDFDCIDGSYFLKNDVATTELYSDYLLTSSRKPYLFRSDICHSAHCGLKGNKHRIMVKWMLNSNSWKDTLEEFQYKNLL